MAGGCPGKQVQKVKEHNHDHGDLDKDITTFVQPEVVSPCLQASSLTSMTLARPRGRGQEVTGDRSGGRGRRKK